MKITAGIDVGSSYTKAILANERGEILAREMNPTGFRLGAVAQKTFDSCVASAGLSREEVDYVVATGMGRHQVEFKDIHATDMTSGAWGAAMLFPRTRTILDVGGQTMKASRIDDKARVLSFRLNDKCAAGTGAFLEKTARYMGFTTLEIGPLLATSKQPVAISGVCAVFAESEVINHLSLGAPPADIMRGALDSLVDRSVQLIKRVKAEPEYTVIGGIMRFETMQEAVSEKLGCAINVADGDMTQFASALGAAMLGHRRLLRLAEVSTDGSPARFEAA